MQNGLLIILDTCSRPPKIPHGFHDGNDFSSGRSVTYSCDSQYVLEGSAVIICEDGQWVGQAPVCRGNQYFIVCYIFYKSWSEVIILQLISFNSFPLAPCSPPKVPTNGFVFGDNLQHQSSVQFWCDVGFVLRGSSTSQCDDGQWDSPTPRCEGNHDYTPRTLCSSNSFLSEPVAS